MSGGAPERVLGSFAPVVLEHARAGDEVAADITAQAVSLLTRTALAASGGAGKLAMLGGLTGDPVFAEQLGDALQAAGLDVVPAAADALSGAAILALRSDLPHERYAIRD
jgi:N-acetylglucosamine kinase-like BadF-type ATPase